MVGIGRKGFPVGRGTDKPSGVDIRTFWVRYSVPSGTRNSIVLCDTRDEAMSIVSGEGSFPVRFMSIVEVDA